MTTAPAVQMPGFSLMDDNQGNRKGIVLTLFPGGDRELQQGMG